MRFAYPVDVLAEPDGITITCPDVPGMITGGWPDLASSLDAARDALALALSDWVDQGQPLPLPSAAGGRPVIAVPVLAAAKLALHEAKVAGHLTNVEIGRRLGIGEREVRRILDVTHNSRMNQVEAALRALGRNLVVESEVAA
jgi:antitoxin HicB